jgi:DNA-binding beta-propeller fold protein YncE
MLPRPSLPTRTATYGWRTAATTQSLNWITLDLSGNAWVINSGNDSVTRIAALRGAALSFTGGGLNVPQSIAIDASGNIWVANYGNSSLSELSASGTPLSPAGTGFTGSGIHQPTSIAINPY